MSEQRLNPVTPAPQVDATPAGPTRTGFLLAGERALVTTEQLDAASAELRAIGVGTVSVLTAPGYTLVHVESDGATASSTVGDTVLGAVLADGPGSSDADSYGEIFAWEKDAADGDVPVAIMLQLKTGLAADYRAWLASGVVDTLQQIWARHDISRHDVLQAGDSVVGFYSCAGPAAVSAAFADPAGVAVMEQGLGDLLDIEATTALPTLEEKITWLA